MVRLSQNHIYTLLMVRFSQSLRMNVVMEEKYDINANEKSACYEIVTIRKAQAFFTNLMLSMPNCKILWKSFYQTN